ncbi:MAG: hypothetical protein ABSG64_05015 [Solirubrobacteraceae bacterium]
MRRRVIAVTTALAFALLASAAQASSGSDRVVGDCTRSQVKPPYIVIACGDGNIDVVKIKWKTFGGATAAGSGRYGINDCTPNCAAGQFHYYAVKLLLTAAKRCPDGHDDYRSLKLTFASKRPAHSGRAFTSTLSCPEL